MDTGGKKPLLQRSKQEQNSELGKVGDYQNDSKRDEREERTGGHGKD